MASEWETTPLGLVARATVSKKAGTASRPDLLSGVEAGRADPERLGLEAGEAPASFGHGRLDHGTRPNIKSRHSAGLLADTVLPVGSVSPERQGPWDPALACPPCS